MVPVMLRSWGAFWHEDCLRSNRLGLGKGGAQVALNIYCVLSRKHCPESGSKSGSTESNQGPSDYATSAAKRFLNCALASLYLQFSKKQGPDRTRLSQLFQAIAIAFTPALCKANARPQAATSNVLPVGWPPHLLYAIGLKPAQPWWGCILPIHSPLEPSIFRNSLKRCPFQDFPYVKL